MNDTIYNKICNSKGFSKLLQNYKEDTQNPKFVGGYETYMLAYRLGVEQNHIISILHDMEIPTGEIYY